MGSDQTRGFQVINRPWTIAQMVKTDAWRAMVPEDYVYIAETDHLLLRDLPNRATPALNVAFFFPYMSSAPERQAAVVRRYYQGDHRDVQPVGPSPAIMHVDTLKRLAPLWLELSVRLKRDREADAALGWVLEMWGYSIACAALGVKNSVWQQLQIEPSLLLMID
uniref:Hydroxyproline O-arabinosyltransferase-like domain-containing protein n=1 Tax=Emiliania huxleyi (strain CCMP1516) TaxID=280463 RepID=A0A0D3IL81_EMIH1